MRKIILIFLISFKAVFAQDSDYKKQSEEVYQNIRNHEFGKVTALFDSSFAARLDSAKLVVVWDKLLQNVGQFQSIIEITSDHQPNYDVVIQRTQFEKKKIDFKIVYGTNKKIKGISFLSGEPREKYELPSYYDEKLLIEKLVPLNNGPVKLQGVLTAPNKPGRFPVVILVHGSGPNDRDETVGPTKIFKDLSIGLAVKGVAVYRYDKRTRVYRAKNYKDKNFTINDETVEDAVAAINMLKQDSLVDSTQIYVCGHSLGGMMLPRIAQRAKGIKGLIYLAANGRRLEDNFLEQTKYVISLDSTKKDHSALLDSVTHEVNKIKTLKASSTDTVNIFFLSPSYWKDLNTYDHLKEAQKINLPMMFLNGGRDYQVTEVDLNLWKDALKNKKAFFKSYPELNHFFIKLEGKGSPLEYNKKGNVDIVPINDMSEWILSTNK